MSNDIIMRTRVDDKFNPYLDSLNRNLQQVSKTATGVASVMRMLQGVAIWTAWSKMNSAIEASVESLLDYQKAATQASAILRANTQQVKALGEAYRGISNRVESSAGDLAKASTELSKAGFDAEAVLKSMSPAADAATASMSDIVTVATTGADVMRAFGKTTDDLPRIMAELAQANNMSSIGFDDLAVSMKYLNGTAQITKVSLEEVLAMVAYMGNQGVKGSTAGTTLSKAMTALLRPTAEIQKVFDEQGVKSSDTFLKRIEAIEKSKSAGAVSLVEMLKQFDERAVRSMFTMTRAGQAEIIQGYVKGIGDQNVQKGISDIATKMRTAWATEMQITQNQFNNLFNGLADSGELDRFVKAVQLPLREFISDMAVFMEKNPEKVTAVLQSTAEAVGMLAQAMKLLVEAVGALALIAPVVAPAMGALWLSNKVTPVIGGLANYSSKAKISIAKELEVDLAKQASRITGKKKYTNDVLDINKVNADGTFATKKVLDQAKYDAAVKANLDNLKTERDGRIAVIKANNSFGSAMTNIASSVFTMNGAIVAATAAFEAFSVAMKMWESRSDAKMGYASSVGKGESSHEEYKRYMSLKALLDLSSGKQISPTGAFTVDSNMAKLAASAAYAATDYAKKREAGTNQIQATEASSAYDLAKQRLLFSVGKLGIKDHRIVEGLRKELDFALERIAESKLTEGQYSYQKNLFSSGGSESDFTNLLKGWMSKAARDANLTYPNNPLLFYPERKNKPTDLVSLPEKANVGPSFDWARDAKVYTNERYKGPNSQFSSIEGYARRLKEISTTPIADNTSVQSGLSAYLDKMKTLSVEVDAYNKATQDNIKILDDQAKTFDEINASLERQNTLKQEIANARKKGAPDDEIARAEQSLVAEEKNMNSLNWVVVQQNALINSNIAVRAKWRNSIAESEGVVDTYRMAASAALADSVRNDFARLKGSRDSEIIGSSVMTPEEKVKLMNEWGIDRIAGGAAVAMQDGTVERNNAGMAYISEQANAYNEIQNQQIAAWSEYYSTIDAIAQESYNKQIALVEEQARKSQEINSLNVNQRYAAELFYENKKKALADKAEAEHKEHLRRNQQLQVMQAIANTAAGIMNIWGSSGDNYYIKAAQTASLAIISAAQISTISAQKFSAGGWVQGNGGPTSDNVLTYLSPNERVVSNTEVMAAGGADAVDAMLQYGAQRGSSMSIRIDTLIGTEEYERALFNKLKRIGRVA